MIALLLCGAVFWLVGIVCILALCKAAARADNAEITRNESAQ